MKKNVPIYLKGICIGQYLGDGSLGIDTQAAVSALRLAIPEKVPNVEDIIGIIPPEADAKISSIVVTVNTGVDVSTHYSEKAYRNLKITGE